MLGSHLTARGRYAPISAASSRLQRHRCVRTSRNGLSSMLLTAEDIARIQIALHRQRVPLRTVRSRLKQWASTDARVVRLRRGTRGQPPWAVPLDVYCKSRCLDPAEVLAALGREQAA